MWCFCHVAMILFSTSSHARIQRGGGRSPDPPENPKAIGYHSNAGLDSLMITKLPSQHSMLGHHRPASETPFKWRFAGGPMMARFGFSESTHQLKNKKNVVNVGSPLTKLEDTHLLPQGVVCKSAVCD